MNNLLAIKGLTYSKGERKRASGVHRGSRTICFDGGGKHSSSRLKEQAGRRPQLDESQLQPMEVSLDRSATTGATKRTAETQLTPNTVEGYIGGPRSFDEHQEVQLQVITIDEDSRGHATIPSSCLTETCTLQDERKNLITWNLFGVVRRVKKSEAADGTHVRMKILAHNKGDLVRWRFVSMEINQYERHDVCAGTPTLKVFRMC